MRGYGCEGGSSEPGPPSTAAGEIHETDEEQRCWTFLADSSKEAYAELKR